MNEKKSKKNCLEGESNSHLRITQAMLGHFDDRYETFVLAVILSRRVMRKFSIIKYIYYHMRADFSPRPHRKLTLYDLPSDRRRTARCSGLYQPKVSSMVSGAGESNTKFPRMITCGGSAMTCVPSKFDTSVVRSTPRGRQSRPTTRPLCSSYL